MGNDAWSCTILNAFLEVYLPGIPAPAFLMKAVGVELSPQ